jgi:hypothetical protein
VDGTHFGTLDPHLPGTLTDRWLLPSGDYDAMVFTDTDVGYGANLFYYLRSTSDVPETGAFWGVGVIGILMATWQWRRRVQAQGLPKAT